MTGRGETIKNVGFFCSFQKFIVGKNKIYYYDDKKLLELKISIIFKHRLPSCLEERNKEKFHEISVNIRNNYLRLQT